MTDRRFVVRGIPHADPLSEGELPRVSADQVQELAGIAPSQTPPPAGTEPVTLEQMRDAVQPGPPAGMLRYNTGKGRGTLIPASFTRYTTAVLEYGAVKYSANNWRQGGSWTSAVDSLLRHLDAFREGEDLDPESGLPHLSHMAFNVMILIEFYDKGMGTDDRFRYPDQPGHAQLPGRLLEFRRPPGRE